MSSDASKSYDLVVIGSGFGASFFLHGALPRLGPKARVLVLERGGRLTPEWQLAQGRNSDLDPETSIRVPSGHKSWQFNLAFGGGTNAWWGNTPRLHPSDFELRSRPIFSVQSMRA